ncbi:hypothetical protein M747DRAFT_301341 [Aspergillus niger ATCC 13496]|uniref:Contig An02c0140, genomic contig n=3 Tax=Aspergillus niger TaxID=5061 RepID=A2QCU4_ASPNC|nr:uncharacterized protein An02g04760 [Aspergillus niger]RDH25320.1 hypothetical protein M747DRAFT_301341 [Aspergillus niger ATCC 13496]CAK47653.1 unnamed protein product [Aspergillus niger]
MSTQPPPPTLHHLLSRLAQAKRLFFKPKSKRRRTQQQTTTKKKPTTTREYSLRKRPPPTSTPTTILTSWRDEDDSTDDDDYDPRIERAYLRRKKPLKRAKNENLSLIVKIKLNMDSESGKAFLASLGMYQDDDVPMIRDEGLQVMKSKNMVGEMDDAEQRKTISSSCKACVEGGRVCSIGDTSMEGQEQDKEQETDTGMKYPCEQCIRDTIVCEPMSIPVTSLTPASNPCITPPISIPMPSTTPEDNYPIIQPTTITTSLTHPITLTPTPQTCSFCPSLPYSLFGHYQPPRTISVLPFLPPGNKAGDYMELHPQIPNSTNHHHNHYHPQTRICVTCALERLRIMLCGQQLPSAPSTSGSESANHKILPLKGYDPDTFDFEMAYTNLAATSISTSSSPWCSLCPHPAFYGCGRLQSRDVFLEEVTEPQAMGVGCGLLLCERCEVLLRIYKGKVEDVVRRNEEDAIKNNGGGDGTGGSRADVGFLLKGGWLWRVFMGEVDSLPSNILL